MVKMLLPLIPEHKGYVEVFGGAGWLLFGKEPSKWEVLNDLDDNLINLYQVIKNNHDEFINSFNNILISRTLFNTYKQKYKDNNYKNNIEKAHILYYLLKAGFGASLPCDGGGCGFGVAKDKSRLRIDDIDNDIKSAYERLKKVTIECRDFRKLMQTFDDKDTFFYIDPPYHNVARKGYPVGKFEEKDFKDLKNICSNITGKFLLTINNDEFINDLFKEFYIINHDVYYGVCKSKEGRKDFKELIITNYDCNK